MNINKFIRTQCKFIFTCPCVGRCTMEQELPLNLSIITYYCAAIRHLPLIHSSPKLTVFDNEIIRLAHEAAGASYSMCALSRILFSQSKWIKPQW